ncbi:MAG TPA: hypothetical protein VN258_16425 [Mobilitalea sp.]|nr:hypothetical protein [Mobilitalea sp.]
MDTLGVRFVSRKLTNKINNLLEYIWSLAITYGRIQQEEYYNSPLDRMRSIHIDPLHISPIAFNISPEDETYQLLYHQGYTAAKEYFTEKP